MAIQSRQGSYLDFDPTKLLPGEWACVRKGDPKAEDGRAVYMAFEPGVVKRMATHEDIVDQVKEAFGDAAEELAAEFTEEMRTATDNATVAAKDAEQAVENANKAVEDANTATSNANDAADKANEAAEKAESAGVDIDYSEIEFDTEEIVVEDPQEPEREIVSDAYKTTGSYAVGDYCIYENELYRCIADTSGEFDATCWEKTLVASELKTLNANLGSWEDVEITFASGYADYGYSYMKVNKALRIAFLQITMNQNFSSAAGVASFPEEYAPDTQTWGYVIAPNGGDNVGRLNIQPSGGVGVIAASSFSISTGAFGTMVWTF